MKNLKHFLISVFLFVHILPLISQEKTYEVELGLNTSYFTHNTTLPFIILNFQHHGVELNVEGIWNKDKTVSFLLNSSLGWYYHDHFANAFYLDVVPGCNIRARFGLYFNTDLGVGYQVIFSPVYMYELNNEGEYIRDKVVARSSFIVPFSLKLGYVFEEMKTPFSIFVKYKWFMQFPYIEEVPLVPHGSLHFGLGVRLKSIPRTRTIKRTRS